MSDDKPIFMTRLVDDSGCMMNGGPAQVGSVPVTPLIRSWTSCRARSRSVPGLKIELDLRQLGHGLGAKRGEPFDAGQRLLQRDGHQRLDFRRGQAERDRLDLDPRRRELREHIDRHPSDLAEAEDE